MRMREEERTMGKRKGGERQMRTVRMGRRKRREWRGMVV